MAKANVILLNSILWNLREITKLAEKIKKHCGDVECPSWRYPLTSCNRLEIFKLIESNRSLDSYTYVLELTYDRLLYVFNLIIKYLETADSSGKFRPEKNVVRPKTLSLASVLHMMWDRMRTREDAGGRCPPADADPGPKSCAFAQTDVCSVSGCSSCEMAQDFVTRIVLEVERISEKEGFQSAVAEERRAMREELVEMSNLSAMSRWLGAILKDFAAVSERAEEAAADSRKYRRRLDSGEQRHKTRTEHLEEETRKLRALVEERDAEIQETKRRITDLTREKGKATQEINAKNAEILDFDEKMAKMKKTHDDKLLRLKEKNVKKLKGKEIEWKKKVELEGRSRRDAEEQVAALRKSLEEAEEETKRLRQLEVEVEHLKEEVSRLNSVVETKEKTIEEYSSRIMAAFPELNGASSKARYKASGNPRVDMENQIEANKLRIELLKSENEKLKVTLEKLRIMEV